MPRKAQPQDEWITSKEAADILTKKSERGHAVSMDYVRLLGNTGKVETKRIDGRTKLYLKSDIEGYEVRKRGDGSIRRAARAPRGKRPDVADAADDEDTLARLINEQEAVSLPWMSADDEEKLQNLLATGAA